MINNEAERRGIAKILGYLNKNDQMDLVLTVTNRMIQNFEAKDCVQLILNYSKDALDCLKKKKIKKDLIFRYLHEENNFVSASSTKKDLMRECLKHWGSASTAEFEMMECSDEEEITINESDACIEFNVSEPADQNHEHFPPNQQLSISQPQWIASQQTADHPFSPEVASQFLVQQSQNQQLLLNQQLLNQQLISQLSQNSVAHNPVVQPSRTDPQILELSCKFGEWFYSVLPQIEQGAFELRNFWEDSLIGVEFEYNARTMSLAESGSSRNVELLRQLMSCNLRFKPNLLPQHDGVRAEMESHGLLRTTISGILYAGNEPVGWFDHQFGLIAENSLHEDRWRIKILQMKLKLSKPILSLQKLIDDHKRQLDG